MSNCRRTTTLAALTLAALTTTPTLACPMHETLGITGATGDWSAAGTLTTPVLNLTTATATTTAATTLTDPSIIRWRVNTTNAKGSSPDPQINARVSIIDADVRSVAYTSTHVYVRTTGVPSHATGPFPNGPLTYAADQNRTARIPRSPQVNTGTKTATGLGNVGIMVNGATFFDARDARTYNNQGVWQQNANYWEASNFDAAKGHPAPQGQPSQTTYTPGNYHYHQSPLGLLNQLDPANTGDHHSPLLGFAFDGFPIYGPYGYANPDGTGGIARNTSSYQLRNITGRTTLPNGTTASSPGPAVSAQFPLGAYVQDFAFVPNSGTLDQHNGRFAVTPDYPQGTYAYFVTLNDAGTAVYPYIVGPTYYGIVDTANIGMNTITVPADATLLDPTSIPEPTTTLTLLPLAACGLATRRARVRR